jgi:hypothetical protein
MSHLLFKLVMIAAIAYIVQAYVSYYHIVL